MKTLINNKNLKMLIHGASIFTTGGGIPVEDQFESLKKTRLSVEIWSLDEFKNDAFLCTVGELGPTDVPPLKKEAVVKKMFEKLKKTTGKNIVGLFPPEIGQESVVLECANLLNLPIADFDPSGFRAVPYFDMNIFNVKKMDFDLTPIVVATDRNDILLLSGETKYKRVEKKLREMTSLSDSGVIFLMGETVSVKELTDNKIKSASYTKALEFGSIKNINSLLKTLKPKRIINGKVISKSEFEQKGFLAERIIIKDSSWNLFSLIVLNEALFLLDSDGKILESIPDRILLLDPNEVRGISGVFLDKNTPLTVAVIDPEPEWRNRNAGRILGKKRFKKLLR